MKVEFIPAGEIVTTHGVCGEVKVLPWVDSPEFLCEFKRVRIEGAEYKVENCRVQKTCNLIKLQGVDTMDKAQQMRGKTLEIYRTDAPKDLIFAAELEGMQVFCEDKLLGELAEVLDYPGNKVYVVRGERSYMIPAVKAFVLSTDMENNRMQVHLIEGMAMDED